MLIAIISAVVAVLVVLILAAIAIPVLLNERGKTEAARTTLSFPPSAADFRRLDDAATRRLTAQLLAQPLPGTRQAAVYGEVTATALRSAVEHRS